MAVEEAVQSPEGTAAGAIQAGELMEQTWREKTRRGRIADKQYAQPGRCRRGQAAE